MGAVLELSAHFWDSDKILWFDFLKFLRIRLEITMRNFLLQEYTNHQIFAKPMLMLVLKP